MESKNKMLANETDRQLSLTSKFIKSGQLVLKSHKICYKVIKYDACVTDKNTLKCIDINKPSFRLWRSPVLAECSAVVHAAHHAPVLHSQAPKPAPPTLFHPPCLPSTHPSDSQSASPCSAQKQITRHVGSLNLF